VIYGTPGQPSQGGPKEMPAPKDGKKVEDKGEVSLPAPATIVVSLPADAKLTVDGNATVSTSGTRVFVSPELAPGKVFSYELTAQVVRNGKTVSASKRVTVQAGQETKVQIDVPQESLAQK